MIRFWKWLETTLPNQPISEWAAAKKIEEFRRSNPECRDLSFPSISAYGANAAIVHYAPKPNTSDRIQQEGLYLLDSGGQYFGGTTDTTRTFAVGKTTRQQRTDYTLVLKGLIQLSRAHFPKGTTGANLDTLARQPLWEQGLDFKHGTGHGVGYYLNVHEGPQNFSQNTRNSTPLKAGMVITIEPGLYRKNSHGIRLENMVYIQEAQECERGSFHQIKTLTCVPFDTAPLEQHLLTPLEKEWLNQYHQTVFEQLAPLLSSDEQTWLSTKTAPLFS
jgi:Xaa-Pro aminopeptidase